MKRYATIAAASLLLAALPSCSKKTSVSGSYAYTSHTTSCLGTGHDGKETLRAWGTGPTKADAIEQARKNAVYDVVFRGIKSGQCNYTPLVTEVNAAERYADYFNPFFADGGEYRNFSTVEMGADKPLIEAKGKSQKGYGVVVTVDRAKLRQQLRKDGVLNDNQAY